MRQAGVFNSRLLEALETVEIGAVERKLMMLRVTELNTTMVANQDICTNKGVLLLPKGEGLTMPMIERLRGFGQDSRHPSADQRAHPALIPHALNLRDGLEDCLFRQTDRQRPQRENPAGEHYPSQRE